MTTATPREAITTALTEATFELAAQQARLDPLQRAAAHAYLDARRDKRVRVSVQRDPSP